MNFAPIQPTRVHVQWKLPTEGGTAQMAHVMLDVHANRTATLSAGTGTVTGGNVGAAGFIRTTGLSLNDPLIVGLLAAAEGVRELTPTAEAPKFQTDIARWCSPLAENDATLVNAELGTIGVELGEGNGVARHALQFANAPAGLRNITAAAQAVLEALRPTLTPYPPQS